MAYYKEIVTKAVVGKGKKATTSKYSITPEEHPNTVLGCWIINHKFSGRTDNQDIYVNGSYDVNVWYSYDNDTKTGVCTGTFNYNDKMNVPVSNTTKLTDDTEVIVSSLSDPNVVDVKVVGDAINFDVRKEMGIEVVGDTKIRVNVEDNYDDYVEIVDEVVPDSVLDEIDNSVNDDYLVDKRTDASTTDNETK
jgi:spore coat protein E